MARYTKSVREDEKTMLHLHIETDATPSQSFADRCKDYVATGEITEAEAERVVAFEREILK